MADLAPLSPTGEQCIGPKDVAGKNFRCLAGERCELDSDCQFSDQDTCVEVNLDLIPNGTRVCSNNSARTTMFGFNFLFIMVAIWLFYCVFVAVRKAARLRRSLAERRAKKKAQAKNNGTGATQLQQRCEELIAKSREIQTAWDRQLEDVHKLYLAEEMRQTQFMFHFLTLATTNLTHGQDQQFQYMYERKLWFLCTYLEQATTGIWYAMNPENGVQANKTALQQAQQLLIRTAEYFQLPSPFNGLSCVQVMQKRYDDAQFGAKSGQMKQLESRALAFKPIFVKPTKTGKSKNQLAAVRNIRRYPFFYGGYIILAIVIFATMAASIGKDNAAIDNGQDKGFTGFGQSFLAVPPQYDIAASQAQSIMIPLLYGFMHNAMFCLIMLPLPLCRGFWRDIVTKFPSAKVYMPVDDLISLHRQLAYGLFSFIFIGAVIFVLTMTVECLDNRPNACLAFSPAVNEFFDPIENVVMLRITVFATWPFMGLLYFARDGPPRALSVFRFFRENWFEFCYYLHVTIAHVTLTVALLSRFEVFFYNLVTWPIYWIENIREILFHTKNANIIDSQLFGRAKDGVPTSMRLKLQPVGEFRTGAGQYFYIKVPSIDIVWHPFTLCSASNDDTVQAHIGIIAGKNDWQRKETGKFTASEWESKKKTWTYKLFKKVSERGNSSIPARVRGPYGCSFTQCFDPQFGGAVVVAAGTGLSAAESVLRESLELRKAKVAGPSKLWVIYSCREEDSLIWAWERIVSLLVKAVEDRVLDIDTLTPRATMFDWIGIQMYVTQSTPQLLEQFTQLNREQGNKVFGLRDSIFLRKTINRGNNNAKKVKPEGRAPGARIPSNGSMASSAIGSAAGSMASSASMSSMGSNMYNQQQQGYPQQGFDMESQGGAYPQPRLAGMRQAAMTIARGQYRDLDLGQQGGRQDVAGKVRDWLLNKVLAGSLDDEDTHIERFLYGVVESLEQSGASRKVSVGFCGPGPLALTISEATKVVASSQNTTIEFVAESQ